MPGRIGSWIKQNLLELIIVAMMAAFLADYQTDSIKTAEFREEMRTKWDEHEVKITVLYFALIADPSLTPTQKEILMEFAPRRSAIIKK
jgi:hypothetical protein